MSVDDVIGTSSQGAFNGVFNNLTVNGTLTPPSMFSVPPAQIGVSGSAAGIWAAPQSCNYTVSYIGTPGVTPLLVTLYFSSVVHAESTASTIEITPVLTTNLIPSGSLNFSIPIVDGGVFVTGMCNLETDGSIVVQPSNGSNYSGSGNGGFPDFSVTYSVS